ncbi:MAG: UpxY family transcription antiterminator [Chitinophagaceae bacterium]
MPHRTLAHWYAVYTKPNLEKKVTSSLENKGIVVYCPLQKVERQWSDRKKILEIPAFKGYVFVNIHDPIRWQVLATSGVLNFVCHDGKPARIPQREIDEVRRFFQGLEEHTIIESDIQLKDIARVYSGPLMGLEGEVTDVQHRYAVLNIPSLGLSMQIKVNLANLQVVGKKAIG